MIRCLMFGLIALFPFVAGCSDGPTLPEVEQTQNLNKIWSAYRKAATTLNRPPANLEELKPHFEPGDEPDKVLVSRDGQPYVLVWNVPLEEGSPDNMPVIAYEATSKNGVREVLTIFGPIPMTDADFEKAKK